MKDLDFYYVLLMFSVNTHGFFKKMKKSLLPNQKKLVDKGSESYSRSTKSGLEKMT